MTLVRAKHLLTAVGLAAALAAVALDSRLAGWVGIGALAGAVALRLVLPRRATEA